MNSGDFFYPNPGGPFWFLVKTVVGCRCSSMHAYAGVPSDIVATAQDKSKTIFFLYYCKTIQRPVEPLFSPKKKIL
jgi:hypothetical protein